MTGILLLPVPAGTSVRNEYDGNEHFGMDFDTSSGSSITSATSDGTVIKIITNNATYGNVVIVDHGDNVASLYAHLDSISVDLNEVVGDGTEIGTSETSKHFHLEIIEGADYISAIKADDSSIGIDSNVGRVNPRQEFKYYPEASLSRTIVASNATTTLEGDDRDNTVVSTTKNGQLILKGYGGNDEYITFSPVNYNTTIIDSDNDGKLKINYVTIDGNARAKTDSDGNVIANQWVTEQGYDLYKDGNDLVIVEAGKDISNFCKRIPNFPFNSTQKAFGLTLGRTTDLASDGTSSTGYDSKTITLTEERYFVGGPFIKTSNPEGFSGVIFHKTTGQTAGNRNRIGNFNTYGELISTTEMNDIEATDALAPVKYTYNNKEYLAIPFSTSYENSDGSVSYKVGVCLVDSNGDRIKSRIIATAESTGSPSTVHSASFRVKPTSSVDFLQFTYTSSSGRILQNIYKDSLENSGSAASTSSSLRVSFDSSSTFTFSDGNKVTIPVSGQSLTAQWPVTREQTGDEIIPNYKLDEGTQTVSGTVIVTFDPDKETTLQLEENTIAIVRGYDPSNSNSTIALSEAEYSTVKIYASDNSELSFDDFIAGTLPNSTALTIDEARRKLASNDDATSYELVVDTSSKNVPYSVITTDSKVIVLVGSNATEVAKSFSTYFSQETAMPTLVPIISPTLPPTLHPTSQTPTLVPSPPPTYTPSVFNPTGQPSGQPSKKPSAQPSGQPSGQPTKVPSTQPSVEPSEEPSTQPVAVPSDQPSGVPSAEPSGLPSGQPIIDPSSQPSGQPIPAPTSEPSGQPSTVPSDQPSKKPSAQPSGQPSGQPTKVPSTQPSVEPSEEPSTQPVAVPSDQPSGVPSAEPSGLPSGQPIIDPSSQPSGRPSAKPAAAPSTQPSGTPSNEPSGLPSEKPTAIPSAEPSVVENVEPSTTPTPETISPSAGQTSDGTTNQTADESANTTNVHSEPSSQPTIIDLSQHPTILPPIPPTSQPTNTQVNTATPTSDTTNAKGESPTSKPTNLPPLPTLKPTIKQSDTPHPTSTTTNTETPYQYSPPSPPPVESSNQPSSGLTSTPSTTASVTPTGEQTSDTTNTKGESPTSKPTDLPPPPPTSQPTNKQVDTATPTSATTSTEPTYQYWPPSPPSVEDSKQPSSVPTSTPSSAKSMTPIVVQTDSPTSVEELLSQSPTSETVTQSIDSNKKSETISTGAAIGIAAAGATTLGLIGAFAFVPRLRTWITNQFKAKNANEAQVFPGREEDYLASNQEDEIPDKELSAKPVEKPIVTNTDAVTTGEVGQKEDLVPQHEIQLKPTPKKTEGESLFSPNIFDGPSTNNSENINPSLASEKNKSVNEQNKDVLIELGRVAQIDVDLDPGIFIATSASLERAERGFGHSPEEPKSDINSPTKSVAKSSESNNQSVPVSHGTSSPDTEAATVIPTDTNSLLDDAEKGYSSSSNNNTPTPTSQFLQTQHSKSNLRSEEELKPEIKKPKKRVKAQVLWDESIKEEEGNSPPAGRPSTAPSPVTGMPGPKRRDSNRVRLTPLKNNWTQSSSDDKDAQL